MTENNSDTLIIINDNVITIDDKVNEDFSKNEVIYDSDFEDIYVNDTINNNNNDIVIVEDQVNLLKRKSDVVAIDCETNRDLAINRQSSDISISFNDDFKSLEHPVIKTNSKKSKEPKVKKQKTVKANNKVITTENPKVVDDPINIPSIIPLFPIESKLNSLPKWAFGPTALSLLKLVSVSTTVSIEGNNNNSDHSVTSDIIVNDSSPNSTSLLVNSKDCNNCENIPEISTINNKDEEVITNQMIVENIVEPIEINDLPNTSSQSLLLTPLSKQNEENITPDSEANNNAENAVEKKTSIPKHPSNNKAPSKPKKIKESSISNNSSKPSVNILSFFKKVTPSKTSTKEEIQQELQVDA